MIWNKKEESEYQGSPDELKVSMPCGATLEYKGSGEFVSEILEVFLTKHVMCSCAKEGV